MCSTMVFLEGPRWGPSLKQFGAARTRHPIFFWYETVTAWETAAGQDSIFRTRSVSVVGQNRYRNALLKTTFSTINNSRFQLHHNLLN